MAALESALEQLRSGQPTRIAANRRSIRIEMNIFHRNHLHLFMSLLLLLLLLCVWFDVFGFLSPGPPCSVSVIVVIYHFFGRTWMALRTHFGGRGGSPFSCGSVHRICHQSLIISASWMFSESVALSSYAVKRPGMPFSFVYYVIPLVVRLWWWWSTSNKSYTKNT